MSRWKGAGKRMQEVCVVMNVCPVLCGIVGRCCDAEHQLKSCQQPYVMMLSLSLQEGERYSSTLAPFCFRNVELEIINGEHEWDLLSFSFLARDRLHLVL